MEQIVYSSKGTLSFKQSLPGDWKGSILSGSIPYTYEGPLGNLTLQKFRDEKFSICYTKGYFPRKIKLSWEESSLLRLQYVLDGGFSYKGDMGKRIKLRPGQFNAVWSPGRETVAEFTKGSFEMFHISFTPGIVQELLPTFPEVRSFQPESAVQWIEDKQKSIYELLNVPYSDDARRFFYKTRIREHLLSFLLPTPKQGLEKYSEDEIERVHRVDHRILNDLTKHHSAEDLASFVKLPEAKLIALFRDIFGVSMFERYKEAKLQKARKYLLETDIQVKVLYEIVGYESYTGFVEAFKERFGISPLQYRKRFKPFD